MHTILLVDDMRSFLDLEATFLSRADCRILTASTGLEAIRVARTEKPDLIVLDIEMPEMNGFEFAEAVRRHPKLRQLPILALSSMCTPASIERGRQAGFDDYIAKFDRPGLIAALKEVMNHHEIGMAA